MKDKKRKKEERNDISAKKDEPGKYETMSQAQNRHGKGRQRNGSDGGNQIVGNNH